MTAPLVLVTRRGARLGWQNHAACHDVDPETMFPVPGTAAETCALAVCARCPVLHDCGDYALRTHQIWGVWGGLSEPVLRALARHSATQRRATAVAAEHIPGQVRP